MGISYIQLELITASWHVMSMYYFFAYLARMKLIDRWGLMRCLQRENVQEHSLQVAIVAHALALIKNKYFDGSVNAEKVALLAIFHDATEVLTGDMPTPVKYFNGDIRSAYQNIESHAASQLLRLLPQDLQSDYKNLLTISPSDEESRHLIKAADTICAYLKCLEELAAGNNEFRRAEKGIKQKLDKLTIQPEVKYFLDHFSQGFSLSIDEISSPIDGHQSN